MGARHIPVPVAVRSVIKKPKQSPTSEHTSISSHTDRVGSIDQPAITSPTRQYGTMRVRFELDSHDQPEPIHVETNDPRGDEQEMQYPQLSTQSQTTQLSLMSDIQVEKEN